MFLEQNLLKVCVLMYHTESPVPITNGRQWTQLLTLLLWPNSLLADLKLSMMLKERCV